MKSPALLSAHQTMVRSRRRRRHPYQTESKINDTQDGDQVGLMQNNTITKSYPPRTNMSRTNRFRRLRNLAAGASPSRRLSCLVMALTLMAALSWASASLWAQSTTVTYVVNTIEDRGDADLIDDLCDVDLDTEGEQCSLRAAIGMHNAGIGDGDIRQIHFNIPGDGPHTLEQLGFWPPIRVPMIIDGSTQPGATCPTADQPANLKIVLDMGQTQDGLSFAGVSTSDQDSSGSIVRGLVIGNAVSYGLDMKDSNYKVECNHIGVAADGITAMPIGDPVTFSGNGVSIGENSVVGGDESHAQRNVIASSGFQGISAKGGTKILNNYIGTTADGLQPLGNFRGIGALGTQIGGTSPLARNVISGNTENGIALLGENNQVWGNYIGAATDGATALPNGGHGLWINAALNNTFTHPNLIGGLAAGEANLITNNGKNGITLLDGADNKRNQLRGNRIFNNSEMGIDIGEDGPDTNDFVDSDDGSNKRQNYPLLTSVNADGRIAGSINSAASQTLEIDFYANASCDESGHGEGETHIGSTTLTTDEVGDAAFDITISGGSAVGQFLTATATDAEGNTSEFSQCLAVDTTAQPTPTPTGTTTVPPTPGPLDGYITDCLTASDANPEPSPTATTTPTTTTGGSTSEPAIFLPFLSSGDASGLNAAAINSQSKVLVDGRIVTGPDGVTIGAVAGSLMTNTLLISITRTSAPTQTIIATPTVHGNYYHISANQNAFFCGEGKGFVLGLPVPDGVSTTNLGIGLFRDGRSDGTLVRGLYDSKNELMAVPLDGLSIEGAIFVLIEAEWLSSQSAPDANGTVGAVNVAGTQGSMTTDQHFQVFCIPDTQGCRSLRPSLERFLDAMYEETSGLSFEAPPIANGIGTITTELPEIEKRKERFGIFAILDTIGDSCNEHAAPRGTLEEAFPERTDLNLWLCIDGDGRLSNQEKRNIRYYYYLALQWGQNKAKWDLREHLQEASVYKGTAAAAMISLPNAMESSNDYERRPVTIPLNATLDPFNQQNNSWDFKAQDFWVYYGKSTGQGLGMFRSLYQNYGLETHDVIDWIGGEEAFTQVYWKWVKNQALLEEGIYLNDSDAGEECTFQPHSVVGGIPTIGQVWGPWVTLQPLQSHVLRLEDPLRDFLFFDVAADSPNVRYKIYIEGMGCTGAAENAGMRFSDNPDFPVGASTDFYVVVANTSIDEELDYQIRGD